MYRVCGQRLGRWLHGRVSGAAQRHKWSAIHDVAPPVNRWYINPTRRRRCLHDPALAIQVLSCPSLSKIDPKMKGLATLASAFLAATCESTLSNRGF